MTDLTPYIVAAIFGVISYLLQDKIATNKELIKELREEIDAIKKDREARNEKVNDQLNTLSKAVSTQLTEIQITIAKFKS